MVKMVNSRDASMLLSPRLDASPAILQSHHFGKQASPLIKKRNGPFRSRKCRLQTSGSRTKDLLEECVVYSTQVEHNIQTTEMAKLNTHTYTASQYPSKHPPSMNTLLTHDNTTKAPPQLRCAPSPSPSLQHISTPISDTHSPSSHLPGTNMTARLDLDRGQDNAIVASSTLLLDHLPLGTELLEDHLGVAALVRVGVVETHVEVIVVRVGGCW
jgi:hypothetical protein